MRKKASKKAMEKIIFSLTLVSIGFVTSGFSLAVAIINPFIINGKSGIVPSLSGNHTTIPFYGGLFLLLLGLGLLVGQAYPQLYLKIVKK